MKHLATTLLCLTCLAPVSAAAAPSKAAPATTSRPAADRSVLPDSAVLARVDHRVVRVSDFNEKYFDSDPEHRPGQDSLGRVEFLNSMINKNVLGLTALAANRELGFEDRSKLREHTERVLSNVLYQRMVIDSVGVTEADVLKAYEQFKHEVRIKHILVFDRTTAESARRELITKRVPWSVAVRKYSKAPDREKDGDMGWRARLGVDARLAAQVFDLQPNQISEVIEDNQGFHVVMVSERRPSVAPALEPMRRMIRDQLVGVRAGDRTRQIQLRLLSRLHVVHDEANAAYAATKFTAPVSMQAQSSGPVIEIDPNLPELAPGDRDRVLARYQGGQITLDQLMHSYDAMPPMMRPTLSSAAAVKEQVEAVILEPTMLQLAYERGIDKDPIAVQLIENKREQMLVEHLYQDSIQARVRVTDAMRRKYYESNKPGFFTFPRIQFAAFSASSKAGMDSLKTRLLAGEKAADILRADSLAGITRGSIQERFQNQHGPYHKVLFEELRPGQVTTDGPDKQGDYVVLQLIAFEQGRQLAFAEVERLIDESLQNITGDQMLDQLIARHKKRYRIEAHPENLMRFKLAAPG